MNKKRKLNNSPKTNSKKVVSNNLLFPKIGLFLVIIIKILEIISGLTNFYNDSYGQYPTVNIFFIIFGLLIIIFCLMILKRIKWAFQGAILVLVVNFIVSLLFLPSGYEASLMIIEPIVIFIIVYTSAKKILGKLE